MERELKLWAVEIATDKMGPSPGRPSHYAKRHVVNVAATDIVDAIYGALQELIDRYGEDFNSDRAWVISANHKGRVNRIVE